MPFPVPVSVTSALDGANQQFEELFKASSISRVVELSYTKEAKVMPPGSPVVTGHANIVGMFEAVKKGVDYIKLAATERQACDSTAQPDTVIELGTFTFYTASDAVIDHGKYLVVWQSEGGTGYKMGYDMFSSNGPASQ